MFWRTRPARSRAASTTQTTAAAAIQIAIARNSGVSVSRAHIGVAAVRSASRPIHSNQSDGASRVLNASRPRSTITTAVDAQIVKTTETSASTRAARWRAKVHAVAALTTNSGRTGAKNRAGGLHPAHHIAKCVTVSR